MVLAIGGLAAKIGPTVWAYAPVIFESALKLHQGSRKSGTEMAVPSTIALGGSQADLSKIPAAMQDIEHSLKTLNSQLTDASLLISKLAESNAALAAEAQRQRTWLYCMAVIAGASVALSVVAIVLSII